MFADAIHLLAQTGSARPPSSALLPRLVPALIVLTVVIAVGAIVIAVIRRSLRNDASNAAEGFTLHGLRQMHARGDLSDEEFERAKAAMIGRLRASADPEDRPGGIDSVG